MERTLCSRDLLREDAREPEQNVLGRQEADLRRRRLGRMHRSHIRSPTARDRSFYMCLRAALFREGKPARRRESLASSPVGIGVSSRSMTNWMPGSEHKDITDRVPPPPGRCFVTASSTRQSIATPIALTPLPRIPRRRPSRRPGSGPRSARPAPARRTRARLPGRCRRRRRDDANLPSSLVSVPEKPPSW